MLFCIAEKKRLFESVSWKDIPPPLHSPTNVWDGKKILLSTSLELVDRRREAVEAGIIRSGGIVVPYRRRGANGDLEEEGEKVLECDVLITRWRHGPPYLSAIQDGKTVGTLAWLYHVESTGVFTPPNDQLLHYPIPKKPIQGFSSHVCSFLIIISSVTDLLAENNDNKLYRSFPRVPQETHHYPRR